MKILLLLLLCSISAYAQQGSLSPIPDCSLGYCSGLGTPGFNCNPGQRYAQMDNPGVNYTCTGIPPRWVQDAGGSGASLTTTNPQTFSGSIGAPRLLPNILGATYFYASSFPSTCTVGGTPYTTQLDCAWRTALATTATATANPTVVVEPGVNYSTCAGLPLILPGATGSAAVNLTSIGNNAGNNAGGTTNNGVATVTQTCTIGTGTVSLPSVVGSASKQINILGVSIDANHLAPYAMQILGYNTNSAYKNIQVANGTTGPAVFGIAFTYPDGWTLSADIEDWQIVDNCGVVNGCGGGGAVTVSLSGGVPSFTVTAPGSQYDANTIATLVGYQNGTRNSPCSSMGVTTPVTSGGLLTGITSTATGCAGTVYVQLTDQRAPQYGLDLENVTDAAKISGIDIRTGAVAGLYAQSTGSDTFYGIHAWGQGLFGIKTNSFSTFVGTNCGEVSLACFDNSSNFAKTIAIGTMYNSGSQYQGYSLFRNEFSSSTFQIFGVSCQSHQTAEYHTLANLFNTVDANVYGQNLWGNSLKDAEYCGSGTGETVNGTPGNAVVQGDFSSPGTTSLTTATSFKLNTTPFVDCTATGWTLAPTVSGSVVTFPSNGFNNGGSITCTDFAGRTTVQAVPNAAGGTASQTFDMTTQFAVSGATWVRLDPLLSSGSILFNAPNVTMQNGTMAAGTGGTIAATTAASIAGTIPSISIVPSGTATTTPITAIQSGLVTGGQMRMELGANFSNFNAGLWFFQYQGGAGSTANRAGVQVTGAPDGGSFADGLNTWNTTSLRTKQYTVATLPTASSLGAGSSVIVTDATTFTPGTCTGGGSDYMIAVTNGSTWSCH